VELGDKFVLLIIKLTVLAIRLQTDKLTNTGMHQENTCFHPVIKGPVPQTY
jgi:hypothetical protein